MCTCITPGLEPPPATIARDVEAVRTQIHQALAAERRGETTLSLQVAGEARAAAERLSYLPVHAEALVQVARALDGKQTAEARSQAEALYFQALEIASAEHHHQLVAVIWRRLVLLAIRMDPETQQARERLKNLEDAVDQIGNCPCGQAKLHHLRGEILYRDGNYAAAVDEKQRAIDAIAAASGEQSDLSCYYHALAKSLEALGQIDRAISLYEQAREIASTATDDGGPSLPDLVELHMNYSLALKRKGNLQGARSELEAAQAKLRLARGDASLNAGVLETFLSDIAYQAGEAVKALDHGRKGLEIYQKVGAPKHRLAEAYTNIANAELKRRNFPKALVAYEAALALRLQHLGNDHYQVGVNHGSLAEALIALSRRDQATTHLREAERIFACASPGNQEIQDWIRSVREQLDAAPAA